MQDQMDGSDSAFWHLFAYKTSRTEITNNGNYNYNALLVVCWLPIL